LSRPSSQDPFVRIRLWPRHHLVKKDLAELLAALEACPGSCDEVWFCTNWGFPTLEVHRQHAGLVSEAASQVNALGIQAGLQIANTLGHGTSPLFPEEGAEWPLMTDEFGGTVFPAPCPRSTELHHYIDQMSRSYATAQPSSVWIDDDLRIGSHGGIANACFCSVCIGEFSRQMGRSFSREQLVEKLNESGEGALRLQWTLFNGQSLGGIARTIGKAFHEVSPTTRLGHQQIEHESFMDCGPDWNPIHDALTVETKMPTGARLGNGFYTDHSPRLMIRKAFVIARQISRLPETVRQICPEIDNFTHNRFGKTPHGTVIEGSLYFAMGCNSISYAILSSNHESLDFHRQLLSKIGSYRPFWESYVRRNLGSFPAGIEIPLGRSHVTRPLTDGEKPFDWARVSLDSIYQLASTGLPLCAASALASAAILHADAVPGLTDDELKVILSGGVMMNGAAAILIQERGFGDLLGVRVTRIKRIDVYERMTSDPLNIGFAGKSWMLWLESSTPAFFLEAIGDSVRSLGDYVNSNESRVGMATSLSENALGGRVAVFGYFDWVPDPSSARRNQYVAAADWISRERLPVILHSLSQAMVVPRVNSDGELLSVFVLNVSIEQIDMLELEFRNPVATSCRWITPEGSESVLDVVKGPHGDRYRTPSLAAWACAYIDFV